MRVRHLFLIGLRFFLSAALLMGHVVPPGTPDPTPPPTPIPTPVPTPSPVPVTPSEPSIPYGKIYLSEEDILIEASPGARSSKLINLIFYGGEHPEWSVVAQTTSGGNWLSVTPQRGAQDADLTVTGSAVGLNEGTYRGTVKVYAINVENSPKTLNVTLRVRPPLPSTLRALPASLTFSATEGETSPVGQKFAVSRVGEVAAEWTVSVSTTNGGNWLAATPDSGKDDGSVLAIPTLGKLPAGVYLGRIIITSPKVTNSPLIVPVTLNVLPPKIDLTLAGVVSPADGEGGAIAPGQLVALKGSRLGPTRGILGKADDVTRKFPAQLGGTKVTFDGVPGAVYYSSFELVHVQAPYEIAGKKVVKVTVESLGYQAIDLQVPVVEAKPAVFVNESRRIAAVNQDGGVNNVGAPAAAGTVVQLFLTGAGLVAPKADTGFSPTAAGPFPAPMLPIDVQIGGAPATVQFAGLHVDSLGVMQMNIVLPAELGANDWMPVMIRIGQSPMARAGFLAVAPAAKSESATGEGASATEN